MSVSLPFGCKRNLYFSLAYSYLLYGLIIYGFANNSVLKPLLITCNRVLRALQNKPRDFPVKCLCLNYNTLPINSLFNYVLLNLVYRCYNKSTTDALPSVISNMFVLNSAIHHYNTRSRLNIHLFHNCSSSVDSRVFHGSALWNDTPDSIKSCNTLAAFSKKLKLHLLNKL